MVVVDISSYKLKIRTDHFGHSIMYNVHKWLKFLEAQIIYYNICHDIIEFVMVLKNSTWKCKRLSSCYTLIVNILFKILGKNLSFWTFHFINSFATSLDEKFSAFNRRKIV